MVNPVALQAKEFADLGYSVFPLHNKLPILKQWPDLATTDHEIIDEWYNSKVASWADGFGICPKDTCVVIDIDVKDGKDGLRSLKWLIANHGLSKKTQVIRTRSGGLHLYYKYPKLLTGQHIKSIANWEVNGTPLDGIDIRGNRGQAVGPTVANGYEGVSIVHVSELAELPDSLVSELPVDKVGGLKINPTDAQDLIYEQPTLKGIIPDVIPDGERHQTLLSLTASWARKVPYSTACVLLKEAISRCEGEEIDYEDYKVRLDDAYDKFEPVIEDKVQWMLDNLVYVVSLNSVYRLDKAGKSAIIPLTTAANYFRNWKMLEEKENKEGDMVTKAVSCFQMWLGHKDRQSIDSVGYKPVDDAYYICAVAGEKRINSYKKNPLQPSDSANVLWFTQLVDFLWEDQADTILDYCAHIIQNPTIKVHWAPLLITTHEGMGKNLFFEMMSRCIGKWNAAIINASFLSKSFNTFLVENRLVLVNEVQEVSKRERQIVVSKLKSYITESIQSIEGKGSDLLTMEIFSNIMIFSNKIDAIDVDDKSRRFHVHINDQQPMADHKYDELAEHLNDSSIANLLNYLNNRDISNFKFSGHAPHTASRAIVVTSNMSQYETDIRQHIEFEYSIFCSDIVTDSSWHYYINHVLHKGQRMSVSQEKYLKNHLLKRLKTTSKGKLVSRQVTMTSINQLSDDNGLVRGMRSEKCLAYTVRNHDKYVQTDSMVVTAKEISDEYERIFLDSTSKTMRLV